MNGDSGVEFSMGAFAKKLSCFVYIYIYEERRKKERIAMEARYHIYFVVRAQGTRLN